VMDRAEVLAQMVKLMWGYRASQVLRTVAELSIADLLQSGPLSAEEIAKRANLVADNTFRLLRTAVAIGLVRADGHNRFYTTPLLDMLRKDTPQSLYYWVISSTGPAHWLPWQALVEAVRSGVNPAQHTLGSDFFTYLEDNPEEGGEFLDSMSVLTSAWASHVSDLIDTRGVSCAVDVGGANGSLLNQLQRVNRELRGVIVERPRVASKIRSCIAESEFGDRTKVIAGSYFEALPAGDLYLLKMVLRTWDSTHCVQILQRCREAMNVGGRIVIIEQVVGSDCNPGIVAGLSDLNMLVVSQGGRERTLPQFDALLEAAGLRRIMVFSTASPHSVIEAVAV
jgi:O-methyltransferase domain/Dimerisation domain